MLPSSEARSWDEEGDAPPGIMSRDRELRSTLPFLVACPNVLKAQERQWCHCAMAVVLRGGRPEPRAYVFPRIGPHSGRPYGGDRAVPGATGQR